MTANTDPAMIAMGLSEAQRIAVRRLGFSTLPYGGLSTYGMGLCCGADEQLALKASGVIAWFIPPGCMGPIARLTPLGLQVRTILKEHPNEG